MDIRSHPGSRALSVQVNTVAVSDHMFDRFLFAPMVNVATLRKDSAPKNSDKKNFDDE